MRIAIPTPEDFSLHEVLHSHGWRHLLPNTPDDERNALTRVERLADSRVVEIQIIPEGQQLQVNVSEDADAASIANVVVRMLQLDRSLDSFHAYCRQIPELSHIPVGRLGRFLCSPSVFEDCVKVLLTTNTTWAQTKGMNARIVDGFGSPLPGDSERHAFPTPEQISCVSFDVFKDSARLGYRAKAVHELARDVSAGVVDLEALREPSIPADELYARLLSLRGIGPYASACLMLYLGRSDRVNADSWARTLLSRELGRPVTDRDVQEHFAQYGQWRGFAYNFYNWKHRAAGASSDVPN
jgi:3-methyladenine DNA glycosylase/8-oxoguanine DNA glycosylase